MREYNVLLENKDYVEAMLVRLAKRAERKGLTPIVWAWGKPFTRTEQVPHPDYGRAANVMVDKRVTRIPLAIPVEVPKYGGWRFIATLQHLEGENIVRAIEGESVPPKYRHAGPTCEHCRVNRRRIDTFLVKHDDGRVMQIGRDCLGDFLGTDAAGKLAASASAIAEAKEIAEDAESGGEGRESLSKSLLVFLMYTNYCIRTYGWVSAKRAREAEDEGIEPTSSTAWRYTVSDKERQRAEVKLEPQDEKMAEATITWAENLTDAEVDAAQGDYLHNLRAVARSGLVDFRTKGLAASMVAAYKRTIEQAREGAERRPSEWVGTVGERGAFIGVLKSRNVFEGQYGYTTFLTFLTPAGDVLQWKASGQQLDEQDVGKTYAITATIKGHGQWKDRKQTELTRAKLEEVPEGTTSVAPAEKPKRATAARGTKVAAGGRGDFGASARALREAHADAAKAVTYDYERRYFDDDVARMSEELRAAEQRYETGDYAAANSLLDTATEYAPLLERRSTVRFPAAVKARAKTAMAYLRELVSRPAAAPAASAPAVPAPWIESYEVFKAEVLPISEGRLSFSEMAERYVALLAKAKERITVVEQRMRFSPLANKSTMYIKSASAAFDQGRYPDAKNRLADAWHDNPLKPTDNPQAYGLPSDATWVRRAQTLMEELHDEMNDKINASRKRSATPNPYDPPPCACRYVHNGEHEDGCFYDV